MTALLKNLVQETANAPGSAINVALLGAPAGRLPFAAYGNGATCFYGITDGVQSEWGIGTVTTGNPNLLARTTVIGNTAGTTARLNFTGACTVLSEIPAEKVVSSDDLAAAFATRFSIQVATWNNNVALGTAAQDFGAFVIPAGTVTLELWAHARMENGDPTASTASLTAALRNAGDTVDTASIDLGAAVLHAGVSRYVTLPGFGDTTFAGGSAAQKLVFRARIDQALSNFRIYEYRMKVRATLLLAG